MNRADYILVYKPLKAFAVSVGFILSKRINFALRGITGDGMRRNRTRLLRVSKNQEAGYHHVPGDIPAVADAWQLVHPGPDGLRL